MFYNFDEANLFVMLFAKFFNKTNHHQLEVTESYLVL